MRNKSEIEADNKIVKKEIENAGPDGMTKTEIVGKTGFPRDRVTDAIRRLGDKVEREGRIYTFKK